MSRDFRLLGAFELMRGTVAISLSNKLRVVLATLLLARSQPVRFDTLIEALWGAQPPESAKANLQVYVMRLRRALGEDGLVTTTNGCYQLDVPSSEVDVTRFHDLIEQARQADGPETEAALLGEALALWRGPALLDVESDTLQRTVVPLLTEERLRAIERRAELAVDLGRAEDVIGELTTLVREHPLRERPWACLIDALSRSGRRAEALAAYRRVQLLFRDELGIEPDSRVQAVHQRVLAEDGEAAPVRPSQLPADRLLVGRAAEQAELRARLSEGGPTPVVVVSGPPGVGKTALAVRVAHQVRTAYPDGQLYADLRGYALDDPLSPELVLERFLRALGVSTGAMPADPSEQSALYRSLLANRRVLVVLDNAAASGQVRPLLPGGSGCAALVTSRQDLRGLAVTEGSLGLPLAPMRGPEAADLLTGLVGAARVSAEPDALSELVAACGQLPLALRIAGANLAANPHLPLSSYVSQLRGQGKLAGLRVHDDDSTAVRAAFDLSYLRLPAPAARLFRALGVTPGPDFAVSAASALMATDVAEAARTLDGLAAANLIFPTALGRYQMHDLIRDYAASRASEDAEESVAAIGRLLDFHLHSARNATAVLYPDQPRSALAAPMEGVHPLTPETAREALAWLTAELPNLVAAAVRAPEHGRPAHARQLAETLRGHLWELGHRTEGFAVWDAALATAQGDPRATAAALDLTGLIHYVLGRYGQAIEHHREALSVTRTAVSLHNLARANAKLGRHENAVDLHEEALGLPDGDAARLLHLNHCGFSRFVSGRPALAADRHRSALELASRLGDRLAQAQAWNGLGLAAWALGELSGSIEAHSRACALAASVGDEHLRGFSLIWLAAARSEVGQHAQAEADASTGIEIGRAIGEPRHEVIGTVVRTLARFRSGATEDAVDIYLWALGRAEEISFDHGEIPLLLHLAEALRHAGRPQDALGHAERSLRTARANGIRIFEPMARTELALCHLGMGDPDAAAPEVAHALKLAVGASQRPAEAAAHQADGLVKAHCGDLDSAVAAWGRASALFAEIGSPAATESERLLRCRRG